ncbi:MAG: AI-2E family transporter [Sphingomonadales bacterium]|nr:MAG: AI-2E family transporter [Sphingomonadales bacterium]TNF03974.1 MAG: AI-2E family transporter [Sphingomonadales bacterium]
MGRRLEDRVFLTLVVAATAAFLWLCLTFFNAIIWAVVAAILFAPMQRWLVAWMPTRPNTMAALTLLTLIAIVIVPMIILGGLLLQEAGALYDGIQSGRINIASYFLQVQDALPDWASEQLNRLGLTNIEAVRDRIGSGLSASFETLASQALNIGQRALSFFASLGVMLYLTFFLLRDGPALSALVVNAVPLHLGQRRALAQKFIAVVRATIKGNMIVAIAQGGLGGLIFWGLGIGGALLWGVSMAFFSLLPAVGTGLVWVPVAIYLFATGAIVKGSILVFCGLFIIGMVDNVLRPILVGRDTRMPDYVVLISTLGGLELFGLSGFIVGPVIAALFIAVWEIFIASRRPAIEQEQRQD